MASQKGNLDIVKALIQARANINEVTKVSQYTHTYMCIPSI